ncbi:MAG: response regulator [Acidobacteriia bacterium]|nr:response regulator [Terriglobia bacterium]
MPTKILLADDSITIQKIVHQTFEHESVELTLVGNGDAAIRKMHEITPDLVLADIFMPGKTGYEVCEYIKQQPELASVPVILLVGAFEPFDEKEATRVQADDHLKKPFAPQMLVETIRKFVTLESSERKAKGSTWPVASEGLPLPPAPADTQWHAEQSQVIPVTPPVDLSRATTRPLVEELPVPPPPTTGYEESQESTPAPRLDPVPPVSEFPTFIEETESPLEISHVHQPDMDERFTETQRLVSGPELVSSPPISEPAVQEINVAAEQEPWGEHPPLTLEVPPEISPEPTKKPEPADRSEASGGYESAPWKTPVAEHLEKSDVGAFAEKGSLLEPAGPHTDEFIGGLVVPTPAPLPEPAPELAPAATVPDVTTMRDSRTMGSEELGSPLTDEFKEFQRELVRHAPSVLPHLGEQPVVEDSSVRPSPVESAAPIEEEVMGPPAPFIPPEEPLVLPDEQASFPAPPPQELAETLMPPPPDHAQLISTLPPAFSETPVFSLPELEETPLPIPEEPAVTVQAAMPALAPGELSPEMIDAIARRVVEKMSSRVVEEIAWEVVPEIAETLLRKTIVEKK